MRSILICSLMLVAVMSAGVCLSAETGDTSSAVRSATQHAAAKPVQTKPMSWLQAANNKDMEWYKSDEARRIAENVLLLQTDLGGWSKDLEQKYIMTVISDEDKVKLQAERNRECSLDNGATHSQLKFLANIYSVTGDERYKQAFVKGVEFLLTAQYPNGGWPQWYPLRRANHYSNCITFNDGAMIGAMRTLDEVARDRKPYNMGDSSLRARCTEAVKKGVVCILKCQVNTTGWCQQSDQVTFAPAKARSYELACLASTESTQIVRFLMDVDNPSPEVIKAVEGAIKWLDKVRVTGVRETRVKDESARRGYDTIHEKDPNATPFWARYYEIGTNRAVYVDRDGIPKYNIAEIGSERRNGYMWTGQWPLAAFSRYNEWAAKWTPGTNVLSKKLTLERR
jgi:PelA/Pel-15E family pectate lyase